MMIEITLVARVIALVSLVGDVGLLWFAWRHRWRSAYFVWLPAFGVFSVILQWASGLTWWLALGSCTICATGMIITMLRELQAMKQRQAVLEAEKQSITEGIQRIYQEIIQIVESQLVEGDTDD